MNARANLKAASPTTYDALIEAESKHNEGAFLTAQRVKYEAIADNPYEKTANEAHAIDSALCAIVAENKARFTSATTARKP